MDGIVCLMGCANGLTLQCVNPPRVPSTSRRGQMFVEERRRATFDRVLGRRGWRSEVKELRGGRE